MIVVQERLRIHPVGSGKTLITIHSVLEYGNLSRHHQPEDGGKEIHLIPLWLYWIIERSIGFAVEIQFTVDISSPNHVLIHRESSRKGDLRTQGWSIAILLRRFLLCSSLPAGLRLCPDALHHSQEQEQEQYLFH